MTARTSLAADNAAPTAPAAETSAQREARIAWWREARVGLFIHWGLYSIPARGEWVQWNEQIPNEEYAKFADQFHPEHFDAAAWAALAKAAGMKYVVLTSRHHDGFALFDDPGNPFTSVATAAHRDFVADYVRAIRNAGLHVGLYYSPLDWRFPGYIMPDLQRKSAEAMRAQYHRQVELLTTRYGPLDVLWFDGGETDWLSFGGDWHGAQWVKRPHDRHYSGGFSWEHDQVYAALRRAQPNVLINGRADMPEDFHSREGDGSLGNFDAAHPWELCITLVKGPWGWAPGCEIKSLSTCVRFIVGAAGRDGNVIINVGPRPDGIIDPPQAQRLREIGAWLQANGESIYGTRGGPILPSDQVVTTHRGKSVYVHVLHGPGGSLSLPPLPGHVVTARLLDGTKVDFAQRADRLTLTVPPPSADTIDTIVKLELDASVDGLAPIAPLAQ